MRALIPIIIVFGCFAAVSLPAFGRRPTASSVVAKFGGECQGATFRRSSRLNQLISKARQREKTPCDWSFCDGAFAYDLNGDGEKEYFVRLGCGATGNCNWGIFSDGPAQLHGTFTAWFFYLHKRGGVWSPLTTYTREGGDQGVITTLVNRRGTYTQTSERTEKGYYGNWQPFLKRMGVPRCS